MGHLILDEWVGKEDGKKNQKLRVMVDEITFLGKKEDESPKPLAKTTSSVENDVDSDPEADVPW